MVTAASRLFAENGYEATSMDAIAVKAGVSVGTVYNYYESKSEILLAIVVEEGEETYAAGAALLDDAGEDARAVIDAMLVLYLQGPMRFMQKPEWRQAVALSILQPDTRFGRRYAQVEARLISLTEQVILRLVGSGHLVGVMDGAGLGRVVFTVIHAGFVAYVCDETATLDGARTDVMAQIDLVLRCHLPKGTP